MAENIPTIPWKKKKKKEIIIYIIKKYLHSIVEIASLNSSHIFGQHNILISMKKMKLFSNSDAMSKIDQKIYPWWGVLDTTLCDKVCQLLATGQVIFSGFLHQ